MVRSAEGSILVDEVEMKEMVNESEVEAAVVFSELSLRAC